MKADKYVSVICEYNPFHFGHKYQLETLKSNFGGVVCIMSGDIVQRGSIAVADKFLRAKAALSNGADLVIELPLPYCCSSAKDFAGAGVHIAEAIGSDYLAFGAEDGEETLLSILSFVTKPDFPKKIKEYINIKGNVSYPKALFELIKEELGEESAEAIKKPNNILVLEYMAALNNKNIKPLVIKRRPEFSSSSSIRSVADGNEMIKLLPDGSKRVFEDALYSSFPRDAKNLDSFFIGSLRRAEPQEREFYAVPDDLFRKIKAASVKCSSVDELVKSCCDKTYTSARIRRAVNSIVFNITSNRVQTPPSYTSVLAANEKGREILKKAKKLERIDIVTKPVRALDSGGETKDQFLFSKSIEDIISMSDPIPQPADKGKSPYII